MPPEHGLRLQALLASTEAPHPEAKAIPQEVLDKVKPEVWVSDQPGREINVSPIKNKLKEGAQPVRKKAIPLKEGSLGSYPAGIHRVLAIWQYGLIRPSQSSYNTPFLLLKKPHSRKYGFVQDIRAINDISEGIHPTVANPYAMFALLPKYNKWFTVLDLKDAFFCIPVEIKSQLLFAFEWTDPETAAQFQYCRTVLPQEFKNSPTIFGETLIQALKGLQLENGVLLQYMDELLISSTSKQECQENTVKTLNHLAACEYKVSSKKAYICKQTVEYLGFLLQDQLKL